MPVYPSPNAENLLLGKGKVFFSRKEASGVAAGFRHLGNVETFELTTEDDVLEKFSSQYAAAPLLKSVSRRRSVALRLAFDEFSPFNLSLALMGTTVTSAAQPATAVVGEVMTLDVLKGGFYKTVKMGPITGVTVKQGAATLVLGTDYTIYDAVIGVIQILESSATVIDGSAITIDYTPTAYPSGLTTVRGGITSKIEGSVLFLPDPTTGPKMQVEVWSVSVRPDGALGLISEDFAQMGLTMAVQDDSTNHPTSPLYDITYLP